MQRKDHQLLLLYTFLLAFNIKIRLTKGGRLKIAHNTGTDFDPQNFNYDDIKYQL